jgi:hypothetical protein
MRKNLLSLQQTKSAKKCYVPVTLISGYSSIFYSQEYLEEKINCDLSLISDRRMTDSLFLQTLLRSQ